MIEGATTNGTAVRQRSVRQETIMFKTGTLPLNIYRTTDYPKEKVFLVSLSPLAVQNQPVTAIMILTPSTSHDAAEEGQAEEESEVEDKEEYDTDSDPDYPVADSDGNETLDNLTFLSGVTNRCGRMVRVV